MKKILIANRGEIAVRIIRACHDLGLATVAVYSEVDREALHVLHADEAVCIGEAPASRSYLKIPNILSACEITGADAIHPGYGFLSENAHFAAVCEDCKLQFIGPSSKTIALLGDKVAAKNIARSVGCPVIPGSEGAVQSQQEGVAIAQEIGFPVLIKAVAGGGGRGIRVVENKKEFARHFAAAMMEAEINFGNSKVYIEKMIQKPRHIEVQIIGDAMNNFVFLGERDCTIQRRRQKLIEETPSPVVTSELRKQMGEAAIAIVRAAGYHSVGTVEFLLDEQRQFYFMEVNTRIQVEHTVTEQVTGIDLVHAQLRVAQNQPLALHQEAIQMNGHAMQFRINAEDPANQFTPSPGKIEYYVPPGGPHIRVDSSCYSGYSIPPNYDSMIAKLIVKGTDRSNACAIAKRALREFHIGGVKTTIPFHLELLGQKEFLSNNYDLTFVDEFLREKA